MKVGDKVTIPSGTAVRLTLPAIPRRSWRAACLNGTWYVLRSGLQVQLYPDPLRGLALELTESDAQALAQSLNDVSG
jgi:hypothetical protein